MAESPVAETLKNGLREFGKTVGKGIDGVKASIVTLEGKVDEFADSFQSGLDKFGDLLQEQFENQNAQFAVHNAEIAKQMQESPTKMQKSPL